jgi:hypothetical protein
MAEKTIGCGQGKARQGGLYTDLSCQFADWRVVKSRVLYEEINSFWKKEGLGLAVYSRLVDILRFFVLGILLWKKRTSE